MIIWTDRFRSFILSFQAPVSSAMRAAASAAFGVVLAVAFMA